MQEDRFQSGSIQEMLASRNHSQEKDSVVKDKQYFLGPSIEHAHNKKYSLNHDIKLGWLPRTQISGPIPLSFNNHEVDQIIKRTEGVVLYYGWRPMNTFEMHEKYCNNNNSYQFYHFHLAKSKFLTKFFKKYYPEYVFASKRKFQGSNQNIDHNLRFDSDFEGGNLDAAIQSAKKDQIQLFIRVDSNTKGHCNYFYFKIQNKQPATYRFHIINFKKQMNLYGRGMRPYVSSKKGKKEWCQRGEQVKYQMREYQCQETISYTYCLSFDYTFEYEDDQTQFCYAVPYTYSMLLRDIGQLCCKQVFVSKLCFSLSGVQVPLLTITSKQDSEKYCVLMSARTHPGEANGSYVMLGFLKFLVGNSPEAINLRRNIVFKIIPMLNPDGVIIGNYRTSFSGKDLNRQFMSKNKIAFPEIDALKDFAQDLKCKYKDKFMCFMDLHGHSVRKNSFFYGPDFPIFDSGYSKCRILPRLFSKRTEMFRFYSCNFTISKGKQATARSYFLKNQIQLCYTFETSNYCYFNSSTRELIEFDVKKWLQLGEKLGLSVNDLFASEFDKSRRNMFRLSNQHQPNQPKSMELTIEDVQVNQPSIRQKNLSLGGIPRQLPQDSIYVEQTSDKFSEGSSDKQHEDEDLTEEAIRQLHKRIKLNKSIFYKELKQSQMEQPSPAVQSKQLYHHNQNTIIQTIKSHINQFANKGAEILPINDPVKRMNITGFSRKADHLRKRRTIEYDNLKNVHMELTLNHLCQVDPSKPKEKKKVNLIRANLHSSDSKQTTAKGLDKCKQSRIRKGSTISAKQFSFNESIATNIPPQIHINQETFSRLMQNSELQLLLKQPCEKQGKMQSGRGFLNIKRKRSITAFNPKPYQRNVIQTLTGELAKSLPKIILVKNQ